MRCRAASPLADAGPARASRLVALAAALAGVAPAQHWAFVPPQAAAAPAAAGWRRDPLDDHVFAALRARGWSPSPEADRHVLLRRAHLVLTGLPPTLAEVAAFAADARPDAYERVVDGLLEQPAAAEHMATAWLDLARFADTFGYQSDFECRTWPWRDWLLQALHENLPWPRFVEQLFAGDLLPDATSQTRTATAFWRLHRMTNEGGSIEAEWRHEGIADRVDTFGAAFLGLTVGCARCHDHKSDPIRQREYYALGTFFAIDESGLYPYSTGGVPQPTLRLTSPAQDAAIAAAANDVAARERDLAVAVAAARASARALDPAAPLAPRPPLAAYAFDVADGAPVRDARSERTLALPAGFTKTAGRAPSATARQCDGDARLGIDGLPGFLRSAPRSVRLVLRAAAPYARAVVLHTSQFTEDADAQGYQLLVRDGRLCWEVVHHWPGSAAVVRTAAPLPIGRWLDVCCTYDGSSTAAGMQVYVDGERVATEVVRDHLAGPAVVRRLELGGRDRDNGFVGGGLERFELYDVALTPAEAAALAGREPSGAAMAEHAAATAPAVVAAAAALQQARAALHAASEQAPELMVMAPNRHPEPRFVLRRGAYDQPDLGQPVGADVPAAVLPWDPALPRDRLGLARWLCDPRHPLAARVVVDRLWAQCFGRGLVATPDNFGVLGARPVHQPLLDALAVDFQRHGSHKRILRRIVTSATFRQASTAGAVQREADPDNELLARGPSFRLPAETLRDQALAAAGLLQPRFGGPSVKPYQPPGLWRDAGVGWGGGDYRPDQGADAHRRSLYTFRKRTAPPPNLMTLDGTSREVCVVRRQATGTPLQALVLLGDPVFTECADALAARELARAEAAVDERLTAIFQALCTRRPRTAELVALRTLVQQSGDPKVGLAAAASAVMASDAAVVLR